MGSCPSGGRDTRVQAPSCTSVTPTVLYLLTRLAGCSIGPGISCGACKLVRTLRLLKKNMMTPLAFLQKINRHSNKDTTH